MLYSPFSSDALIRPVRSRNAPGRTTSFFTIQIRPARSVTKMRVESDTGAVTNVGLLNVASDWSVGVPAGGGGGGGGGGGAGGLVGGELNQSAHPASRNSATTQCRFIPIPPLRLPVGACRAAGL